MLSMTPRLSVCIPAFNAERYVGATVASVLEQDVSDVEIIVVDDRSTDGTASVVGAITDPRLRVEVNETNLGPAANWQRAVDLARAPYVKLLCSDDVLYPGCLRRQADVLDADADGRIGMVAARRDVIDPAGRVIVRGRGLAGMRGRVDGRQAVRRAVQVATTPFGEPSFVLFRADALRDAGPFRSTFGTLIDVDLYARVLRRWDAYLLDEVVGAFRLRTDSWSNRSHREQARNARRLFADLAADPSFGITRLDRARATVLTTVNSAARRVVFAAATARAALVDRAGSAA